MLAARWGRCNPGHAIMTSFVRKWDSLALSVKQDACAYPSGCLSIRARQPSRAEPSPILMQQIGLHEANPCPRERPTSCGVWVGVCSQDWERHTDQRMSIYTANAIIPADAIDAKRARRPDLRAWTDGR